jgi:hypothetical protein
MLPPFLPPVVSDGILQMMPAGELATPKNTPNWAGSEGGPAGRVA